MKLATAVLVRANQNHMATTFEFTVSCERGDVVRAKNVLDEAHARVSRMEDELSEFRPDSPVSRLNRARALEKIEATPDLLAILELADRIRTETTGSFDCTFRSKDCEVAPAERLKWNRSANTVWKTHDRVHVGFGAIGKGYALDVVCLLIEQAGFENYLLSAGGSSIVISGYYCQGRPWQWGWSWSRDDEGAPLGVRFEHSEGQRIAIGVSGTHEQGRHIVNPQAGNNPDNLKSALVAQSSCAEADALSTALFVSGHSPAKRDRSPVAWIDGTGRASWNRAFQSLWGSVGLFALFCLWPALTFAADDEAVDLSSMGADAFTPYIFERRFWWIALPSFMLGMILLHLLKNKPAKRQGSHGNEKK